MGSAIEGFPHVHVFLLLVLQGYVHIRSPHLGGQLLGSALPRLEECGRSSPTRAIPESTGRGPLGVLVSKEVAAVACRRR